jgi:branched-chain amino acid transport system permease protein
MWTIRIDEMELTVLMQYITDGVMVGMTYALVAMGLTLIFGMMDILNFAHGELYMLGGLMAYYLTSGFGLGFFPALGFTIIGAIILGYILDRLLMKRIRNAPHAMTAAVTIGLSIFLANSALILMGPIPKNLPTPFELRPVFLGSIMVTRSRLFASGAALVMILFTNWMIAKTKLGRAMRATLQDKMAAQLVGIKTDRILTVSFAYGSMLAAVAGVLLGSIFVVSPFMGESMIGKAWTVVIVGGMGNITGAIFAGILLGVVESIAAGIWTSSWAHVVGFALVVVVLLVRPQGLFGKL